MVQPHTEAPVTLEGWSNAGRLAAGMVLMGVTGPTVNAIDLREARTLEERKELLETWWKFYDQDVSAWSSRTQYQVRIIMRYLEIPWCIHMNCPAIAARAQTPSEMVELTREHGPNLS